MTDKPWGKYEVLLKSDNYIVKKITLYIDKRLSLQYHNFRSEHWTIVQGKALINIGDDVHELTVNQSIYIPKMVKHRITNIGIEEVVFIETQVGFCDEMDIVRLEDDYGRI